MRAIVRSLPIWAAAAVFFMLQNVIGTMARGRPINWFHVVWSETAYWIPFALATPLLLGMARRFDFSAVGRWRRDLAAHLGVMALFAVVQVVVSHAIEVPLTLAVQDLGPAERARYTRVLPPAFWVLMLTAWYKYWMAIGVILAHDYQRRWRDRDVAAARLDAQLTQARLDALRAQLQPHFLFNALHTAVMLNRSDPPAAGRVLLGLSELLRRALELGQAATIPLEQELEFADRYLALEAMRMGERLRVELEAPDELWRMPVPALLLQPLVENAVRHGAAAVSGSVTIRVRVERRGAELTLEVSDTGPGLPPGFSPHAPTGVGLANLTARLALLGGRLELLPNAPTGVRAVVTVPAVAG